jgi:hypothetical protein
MKTFLPSLKQMFVKLIVLVSVSVCLQQVGSAQPLSFKSPVKESGTALAKGATYRFSNVATNVDALVKIEDLVNGATITEIDQTGTGPTAFGYENAFQPAIYCPGGSTTSYALFSVKFVQKGTTSSVSVDDFSATSVDLDGNSTLKEFSEITISGSNCLLNFLTQTLQISVQTVTNGYKGTNLSGIEYDGIDTAALSAMYTVKRTDVSSFNLKLGAVSTGASPVTRQYSLYMKDFSYSILPVKLSSFTASLFNKKVDLKWTTATEMNVSHFAVERSTDGISFSEAGLVFAYGNSTDSKSYSLPDDISSIQSGIIYYRLRTVDIDGKSELSETRVVRIGKTISTGITILTYPNPVSAEVRITVPANWQNKKVMYDVLAMNGQVMKSSINANSGQTETMNISSFAPGLYIVRATCEGQTAQQKIVKN